MMFLALLILVLAGPADARSWFGRGCSWLPPALKRECEVQKYAEERRLELERMSRMPKQCVVSQWTEDGGWRACPQKAKP